MAGGKEVTQELEEDEPLKEVVLVSYCHGTTELRSRPSWIPYIQYSSLDLILVESDSAVVKPSKPWSVTHK